MAPDLPHYRLRDVDGEPEPELAAPLRTAAAVWWSGALVAAAALGAVLYLRWQPPAAAPEERAASPTPATVSETTEEVAPAAGAPEPLPPLDASDAIVRQLVAGLSSRPELIAWLAGQDLVRAFVAAVDNIARGTSPKPFLASLRPTEPFRATDRGGRLVADPHSFARYDRAADAFASLDPAGVAAAYARLAPLCETAYRELGVEGTFQGALERAIGRLLAAPDAPEEAPLLWNFVTYEYADPALESLPEAEKQFLRMGPRNMRLVKAKLRELAQVMDLRPVVPQR